MATLKRIPDGYHTLTPYLLVDGLPSYLEFLKRAFDAKEDHRSTAPDGTVVHAAVKIGNSMMMMGQPRGEWKASPCMLYMYVDDVDAAYARALQAGAKEIREPRDEFYGDRSGGVQDPAGNQWWIATHLEDVSPAELEKRFQAMAGQH